MNEWKLCSKELPSKSGKYFVTIGYEDLYAYVELGYFSDAKGRWLFAPPRNVVAWMPIPEPYKRPKQCPFCCGEAKIMDMGYPHWVYCKDCGAKIHGMV